MLVLTNETADFEGNRVVIVKHGLGTMWVDPAKDYLPVRYTTEANGRVENLIEISYKHDDRFGWLPKSWKSIEKAQGRLTVASDVYDVKTYSINPQVPIRHLMLKPPVALWWWIINWKLHPL